jgi:hypothetical protein
MIKQWECDKITKEEEKIKREEKKRKNGENANETEENEDKRKKYRYTLYHHRVGLLGATTIFLQFDLSCAALTISVGVGFSPLISQM